MTEQDHDLKTAQARAQALVERANALHAAGSLADAIELYQRAIELFPPYSSFNLVVADGLRALGRTQEAAEAYRAVVAEAPDHGQAWQSLGEVALHLGHEDEARAAFIRAQTLRGELSDTASDGQGRPGFLARFLRRS